MRQHLACGCLHPEDCRHQYFRTDPRRANADRLPFVVQSDT